MSLVVIFLFFIFIFISLTPVRSADEERRKEYQMYLQDMNDKLKDRPLLFERTSQTNARNQAEKRYEEILRGAGIHGDELGSFLEGAASEGSSIRGSYTAPQSESEGEELDDDGSYVATSNKDGSKVSEYDDDDDDDDDDDGDRDGDGYSKSDFESEDEDQESNRDE